MPSPALQIGLGGNRFGRLCEPLNTLEFNTNTFFTVEAKPRGVRNTILNCLLQCHFLRISYTSFREQEYTPESALELLGRWLPMVHLKTGLGGAGLDSFSVTTQFY